MPAEASERALAGAIEALRMLVPIVGMLNARLAELDNGYATTEFEAMNETLERVGTLIERAAEHPPPDLLTDLRHGGAF